MKNKTFACVMGLVLALSLTACGEEEVIVENTNEEVSVAVQTQEATEAPTETDTPAEADENKTEEKISNELLHKMQQLIFYVRKEKSTHK